MTPWFRVYVRSLAPTRPRPIVPRWITAMAWLAILGLVGLGLACWRLR